VKKKRAAQEKKKKKDKFQTFIKKKPFSWFHYFILSHLNIQRGRGRERMSHAYASS
jgi:hypothetical protein